MNKQESTKIINTLDQLLLLPIGKLYGQIQDINDAAIIKKILDDFNDIIIKGDENIQKIIDPNLLAFSNKTNIQNFKANIEALLCGDLYFLRKLTFIYGTKVREMFRIHIQTKYPYYIYCNYLQDVNMLLTCLNDCEIYDEKSLCTIFNDDNIYNNIQAILIWTRFKEWFKIYPYCSILKQISKLETSESFIEFMRLHNKINTGCFRYSLVNFGDRIFLIRDKYKRRFCNESLVHNEKKNIIEDASHPLATILDEQLYWNCSNSMDIESLLETSSFEKAVFNKGCKALCNPHNYNLAKTYLYPNSKIHPIDPNFNKKFIYVCETGSILRLISLELQEHSLRHYTVIHPTNIFNYHNTIILLLFIIIIILIVYFYLYIYKNI